MHPSEQSDLNRYPKVCQAVPIERKRSESGNFYRGVISATPNSWQNSGVAPAAGRHFAIIGDGYNWDYW